MYPSRGVSVLHNLKTSHNLPLSQDFHSSESVEILELKPLNVTIPAIWAKYGGILKGLNRTEPPDFPFKFRFFRG